MKLGPERVSLAERIFSEAAELPETERGSFLSRACGGDDELRDFVLNLLGSDASAGASIEDLVARSRREAAIDPKPADELSVPPATIGVYSIQGVLGHGGMGVVYKAIRKDAFEKTVAIKVVKRGMDTDAVLERFRQERQILASFDHPNIARLIDGGQTEDGRPYLVMDFVEGRELMDFIRAEQPTIEARLRLFVEVCRAVDYAHKRLVVHRDLKPSNIRVNEKAQPTLLDFGIAKLIATDAQMTQTGFPAMTPQYAAPEQVRGEPITVAADVYALGLLLFEMLTLAKAHRIAALSGPEVYRVVCVEDPPGLCATDKTQPRDLDAIVSTALRKEPARRYGSVQDLAEDIQRFLDGKPVQARAGSRSYRASKFLKRHWRGALVASLAMAMALTSSVALYRFARAAEREKQKAEEVSSFLTSIFRVSNPTEARGNTITAREILDAGAARLTSNQTLDAEVKVDIIETVAQVYDALGLFRKAEGLLEQAVALRRQVGVEADLASTVGALGSIQAKLGQFQAAVPLLRESLAIQRRLRPDHRDVARVENDLGVVLYYVDECSESRELLSRALRYAEANGPRGIVSTAKNNLGLCDVRLAEFDKAIAHYQEALAVDKEAGPLTAANAMTNLGVALAFKARYAEAEPLLVESVDIRRRLLPTAHPELSRSLSNLARVLLEVGDVDRAMAAQEEAAQIRSNLPRGALAAGDSYTAGAVLLGREKWTEAATKLRDAVELAREFLGAEHHDTLQSISALSVALARTGHREEALSLQNEALKVARRRFGERHSLVAVCETRLGALLVEQGLNEEALTSAKRAAQTAAELHGPDHPRRADALMVAGRALAGLGRRVGAEADLIEALRIRKLNVRSGSALLREAAIAIDALGKEARPEKGPQRPS